MQKELASIIANKAAKQSPFEIIPLETTGKENNWKTEETLARVAVTLETERIKVSKPWCLWWWYSYRKPLYSFTLRCSSPWCNFRHHIFTGYVRHNLEVVLRLIEWADRCQHHPLSILIIYLHNLTFIGPCIVIYSYNKANEMHHFSDLFDKVL